MHLSAKQRHLLIKRINSLPQVQFEEILFALKPPGGILPSSIGAQGMRAAGFLEWVESPTGPGLREVLELLQEYISFDDFGELETDKPSETSTTQQQPVPTTTFRKGPFQAPPLPQFFVERPEHLDAVKAPMLPESQTPGTLVVSAIYGLGGIGKSVLASALAHHPEIQDRYCDGILWATLGQNPDLLPLLSDWIQALGDYNTKPTSLDSASSHLRTLLYDKRVLLVVDDVWNPNHADPFRVGGENCCVLVTTRSAQLANVTRYDLDVMTENQSVQMLANAIHHPLSDEERHAAETLAKEVGYLPLALELTAAQVEEGVPWSQLLQDLRSEVADLTALDRVDADEVDDDGKRRKHSLVACFNLSVKLLTKEQLALFAWLGVLPEDVSVTPKMAATLWNLPERQAAKTLLKFKQKALLLSGSGLADGTPTYRMHDLMHDLAVRLLQRPVEPECDKELPGLGLTKAEAHAQLLERYQAKTQNNQWHTLPKDGYIHAHLTWHMEQAGQIEAVHDLLQETTTEGRNAWYEACDALGQPAQFVSDLGRAWELAEKSYVEDPTHSIGLQCHYGLIKTTLNTLVQKIPAELIAEFVENGFWSPAQGLAYAQQAQKEGVKAQIIRALVHYLPESLLPRVVQQVRSIRDEYFRAITLHALAKYLPELDQEALAVTRSIQDEYNRALALCALGSSMPELYKDAFLLARTIQQEMYRANALVTLAPHLPEDLYEEAFIVARTMEGRLGGWERVNVLIALAPRLPEHLYAEALIVIKSIQATLPRTLAMIALGQHMPELYEEALTATRSIQDVSSRAKALVALAPHMPELYEEALTTVQSIQDETSRWQALLSLAPHLPEHLHERASTITFTKASATPSGEASTITFEEVLNPTLEEGLNVIFEKALMFTRIIQDKYSQAVVFISAAQYLPGFYEEALTATRALEDESSRKKALVALAPHLPEHLLEDALVITRSIHKDYDHADAMIKFALRFPELREAALAVTRSIQVKATRVRYLTILAQDMPELYEEAFTIICSMPNGADALYELAPHLPKHLLGKALTYTRSIQNKTLALRGLVPHLPKHLHGEALAIARSIQNDLSRAYALSALAQHKRKLRKEALTIARSIRGEPSRQATLLITLAQHFPDLYEEVFAVIRTIRVVVK